jgi:UDP-N-acetylglucosamine 2-epimerase
VNVGGRQDGRRRGANVIDVDYDRGAIVEAVRSQLEHGPHESEAIYGDGKAGERIADILARNEISIRKRIAY